MFFRLCSPPSTKLAATLPCTCRQASSEIEMPPGSAIPSIRAAMLTPSPGMAGEQQAMLVHQAIDALAIDGSFASGSPLALEERGDPPVAVGGARVDQAPDIGGELDIARTGLGPALGASAIVALDDVR